MCEHVCAHRPLRVGCIAACMCTGVWGYRFVEYVCLSLGFMWELMGPGPGKEPQQKTRGQGRVGSVAGLREGTMHPKEQCPPSSSKPPGIQAQFSVPSESWDP